MGIKAASRKSSTVLENLVAAALKKYDDNSIASDAADPEENCRSAPREVYFIHDLSATQEAHGVFFVA